MTSIEKQKMSNRAKAKTDATKRFDVKTLNQVESFLNQPGKWSRNNGGK